jgi:uncharacterized membrane protein YkvA (DUF1232 family)
MNSNDIRSQIQRAVEKERRTGNVNQALAAHLARTGASMSDQQRAECLGFITAYIQETPDILDAAFSAARGAGVLQSMQPIFDAAFNYWADPNDVFPDHIGLLGLVDDAYLSRLFIETISNLHRQQTGAPLLAGDLGPANRVVRGLIGEPFATQLDAAVGQTVAAQAIQASMQQLMQFGGGLSFGMGNLGAMQSAINMHEIEQQVDVQLGAMGIF